MTIEKRNHKRVKPKGLQAGLAFSSTQNKLQEVNLDAEIIDISYSGIRVKLKDPLNEHIFGNIKITMILPESGAPFSVHGILKHQQNESICGLHYVDHVDGSIDDLMFECIGLDDSTVFIKTV